MKAWSNLNPTARLCISVAATMVASHGLVRISASLLGATVGYYVSIAVLAALAFGFCSYFEMLLSLKNSTAKK